MCKSLLSCKTVNVLKELVSCMLQLEYACQAFVTGVDHLRVTRVDYRASLAISTSAYKLEKSGNRPDICPEGCFVIYEYPFKIGFKWPYSHLSRLFILTSDLASGQLMPQFWRVVQVIERPMRDWESPFDVNDLLTAYSVKDDAIKFDDVKPHDNSVYRITQFLSYSSADRSYYSLSSTGDDNEVTIVKSPEVAEVEEMREEEREAEMARGSSDQRKSELELARLGKDKRKAAAAEPSSRGGGAEGSGGRGLSGISGDWASGSDPLSSDKGKGPADIHTVNFTLPSDFMSDDVLDRARIFPHLLKFLLPNFKEKFKTMKIDDTGVPGFAWALQGNGEAPSGHAMSSRRGDDGSRQGESCTSLREGGIGSGGVTHCGAWRGHQGCGGRQQPGGRLAVAPPEAKERKGKLQSKVGELEEEVKAIKAFTRMATKAAMMRSHLMGKNPLANAKEDLDTYLAEVGNEQDLGFEDEKDVKEVEVDKEEAKVGEAQTDDASTSMLTEDVPPS
ncbi:hypothetical protein L6452_09096 [Arctium lappa]|uniref:Uncharacterized protein n=1 Tax=Arctium lappa TaxID=4217 RepID=A0ACB9DJE7_ARCLA|nr:hypothetical protein L6452_09096 [Arctium lappa]